MGQEFDNNIYPLMNNNFGEESNLDNNDNLIGGENVMSDKIKYNIQSIIDIDDNNIKRIGGVDRED